MWHGLQIQGAGRSQGTIRPTEELGPIWHKNHVCIQIDNLGTTRSKRTRNRILRRELVGSELKQPKLWEHVEGVLAESGGACRQSNWYSCCLSIFFISSLTCAIGTLWSFKSCKIRAHGSLYRSHASHVPKASGLFFAGDKGDHKSESR